MNSKRKRRIYSVLIIMVGVSAAAALALYALRRNINLYYTPSQLLAKRVDRRRVRLGGMVVKGSVHHIASSLKVNFVLTDFHHTITVHYNGILPSLFREGQGIVAEGRLNASGTFMADQVLAKHDEDYRPPEIAAHGA